MKKKQNEEEKRNLFVCLFQIMISKSKRCEIRVLWKNWILFCL